MDSEEFRRKYASELATTKAWDADRAYLDAFQAGQRAARDDIMGYIYAALLLLAVLAGGYITGDHGGSDETPDIH